jgi:hypothetical protein
VCVNVPGVGASPRFTIHAKDNAHALRCAQAWAYRQGFYTDMIQGMSVRPPTETEAKWDTNDDWIPRKMFG